MNITKIIAVSCVLLSLSCDDDKRPIETKTTPNNYAVSLLFEQDGVRVYRFFDKYEYRYFATSGAVKWSVTRDTGTGDGRTITDHHEVQTTERTR